MRRPERPGVNLGYHAVGYVDLLGQANALMQIDRIPTTQAEKDATVAAIRNSAGRVKQIREAFEIVLTEIRTPTESILAQLPPERHEEFRRLRHMDFRQRGISDAFVISTSLSEPQGQAAVAAANGVFGMLVALAGVSLIALAAGVPLRGGMDVGLGLDLFPDEIYGPVLVRAYSLESHVAQYPRIVVGDNVATYLDYLGGMATHTDQLGGQMTAGTANRARQFLCTAPDDPHLMVHFLSPLLLTYSPGLQECIPKAHHWVRQQAQKYETAPNLKLLERYNRLLRYFDAHVSE